MNSKQRWGSILVAVAAIALMLPAVADAQGVMWVKNNRVGIGTDSPAVPLHNKEADARVRVEATGAAGFRTLFDLINNGTPGFRFQDTTAGGNPGIWQFRMGGAGAAYPFVISNQGTAGNQMQVNANGNVTILGNLTEGSSRTRKHNIEAVDGREILARVTALPVAKWSYNDQSARHLGPMAEDFYEVFGLGNTATGLATIDTSGVALAAIQGLHQVVQEKDNQIESLTARLAALEQAVASLAAQD